MTENSAAFPVHLDNSGTSPSAVGTIGCDGDVKAAVLIRHLDLNYVIFTLIFSFFLFFGFNIFGYFISVPDRDSKCCTDPGISGTSVRGEGVAAGVTKAETDSSLQCVGAGSSRDPTMMKQT